LGARRRVRREKKKFPADSITDPPFERKPRGGKKRHAEAGRKVVGRSGLHEVLQKK